MKRAKIGCHPLKVTQLEAEGLTKMRGVSQQWLPTALSAPAGSGAETPTIWGTESFSHTLLPTVCGLLQGHAQLPARGRGGDGQLLLC